MLEQALPKEQMTSLFGAAGLEALEGLDLLVPDVEPRSARAALSLYPVADRLVFADHRFPQIPGCPEPPQDPVMYLGLDSHVLARATIRRPVSAVLDLCSGSGVHAILAATHAERVVGVDVNPRAVKMARLNAALNGVPNARFVEGDLYEPLEPAARFDLILANPPFVPSPSPELLYRDGGPSGTELLRPILEGLKDRLARGGVAQVFTQLGLSPAGDPLERLAPWLCGANLDLHALRIREESAGEYALAHASGADFAEHAGALSAWSRNLAEQGFSRVVTLVLTLRATHVAPVRREVEAAVPRHAVGEELARVLDAERCARDPAFLRTLGEGLARTPDGVTVLDSKRCVGGRFVAEPSVAVAPGALGIRVTLAPLERDLIERLDGRRTVAEVVLGDADRRALASLIERGIIEIRP